VYPYPKNVGEYVKAKIPVHIYLVIKMYLIGPLGDFFQRAVFLNIAKIAQILGYIHFFYGKILISIST
jgi:hypothetical protein